MDKFVETYNQLCTEEEMVTPNLYCYQNPRRQE